MRMFKAIFIANVKEYVRDKSALFWFLVFPLVFVFIFGWVFTGGNEATFNVGIIVHENNQMSQRMVETFESVDSFNVFIEEGDGQEELNALKNGERTVVIELPAASYNSISAENPVDVPIYFDASQQQTSQMLINIVKQIFNETERQLAGIPRIFNLETESIQSERLTDFDYILPGILAMALMQLGLFGSIQFLSLREKKIVRGLGVTPLSRLNILGSEVLLRLILGIIQTIIILGIGYLVFDITIVSNIFVVLGMVMLGSVTFISLGYMLISFVSTTEGGQGLVQAVQFPMLFLSGIFFPHELMPDFIQPLVKALPLTYLGDALRSVITGMSSSYSMTTNILVLIVWFTVSLLITIKFWRWD